MPHSPLRDLITDRLNRRWDAFAQDHPHLAAAIDRIQLIEQTVDSLQHDPQYLHAMRAGDLDDAQLQRAAQAMERIEQLIALALPR